MYSIDLIQDILVSIVSVSFYLNTEWMYFSPSPVHFFNDTSEVLVIWLQLFVLLLLQCKMWVHFTWYQPYFKVLVDMEAADTSQWYFKQKNILQLYCSSRHIGAYERKFFGPNFLSLRWITFYTSKALEVSWVLQEYWYQSQRVLSNNLFFLFQLDYREVHSLSTFPPHPRYVSFDFRKQIESAIYIYFFYYYIIY